MKDSMIILTKFIYCTQIDVHIFIKNKKRYTLVRFIIEFLRKKDEEHMQCKYT